MRRRCCRCQVSGQDEVPTFSHDSEPSIPPVSQTFRAKTVSFTSRMMTLSRGEREPTINRRAVTKNFRKETNENVWQTLTAAPHQDPPESTTPAATLPEGPTVAANKDVIAPVAGRPHHHRPSCHLHGCCRKLDQAHHQTLETGHCYR